MLKLHVGLVLLCILYIVAGSAIFYHIEKPEEILRREQALMELSDHREMLLKTAKILIDSDEGLLYYFFYICCNNYSLDKYESSIFQIFEYPVAMTIFEANETPELWTVSSSILFTATTVIPIGFGIVTPITKIGRLFLIGFAVTGIPLAVATLADLGKFVCHYLCKQIKDQSVLPPTIVFTSFLVYPTIGGILISCITTLDFFDSLYYCIMTILMIGYGDFSPSIPLIMLLVFIVIGVILVTVSIDAVGADIINHIHFMGRQVSKAKSIAEKVYLVRVCFISTSIDIW
ncbi:unnamed protein product [Enterobius vermicularis]|uniref:Ion channel n=1 Tax=Enterobius vermicularis TaxID=51028 RepID=A0A0N4VJ80_ENTVE|nr:unnamed protein product [Enterobius vermicularis]